ncbi:hypothetical protein SZ39_2153 [Bacillus mycoides]|nr:hypothetical protein SZ39_2153 [Bacillus mycoides]
MTFKSPLHIFDLFFATDGLDINEMLFFVHGFLTSLFTVF